LHVESTVIEFVTDSVLLEGKILESIRRRRRFVGEFVPLLDEIFLPRVTESLAAPLERKSEKIHCFLRKVYG